MYKFNSKKLKHKQHLTDKNGITLCKAENGTRHLDRVSDDKQAGRAVCRICIQLSKKGRRKKKPSQGIRSSKRDAFLNSWEWKQVRYRVLKASNGMCQCCGRSPADGAQLQVDHIKPRKTHPELALDVKNLQVLCAWCNQGKGSWDDTDWREPRLTVIMGERVDE
jgi:5-methylcytosine-specific restriction endonuclease McrA